MAIRKLTYRDNTGKVQTRDKWYGFFTDHGGTERKLPLFADKKASAEAERKIRRLVDLRGAGQTLPMELVSWLEGTTPAIREKLVEFGIVPATMLAASKPLSDHLDEWKAALLAKGNDRRDVEQKVGRVRSVMEGCGFIFWTDISASRTQTYLHEMREGKDGIGPQTFNHYIQNVKQFAGWMVKDGRASMSPLAHLQKVNAKTDVRHERRALSIDELQWIIDTTAARPEAYGMDGAGRALLYRFAVCTGLRTGEIRSLTRASFVLTGDNPSVTVKAAYSKHRRDDVQPIPFSIVAALTKHLANKLPDAKAFHMPVRTEVIRMWRADLSAAKKAWVEQADTEEGKAERERSNFLAYEDDAGRFADAHSWRHTFITNLVIGGVHPKTAQQLARHGTIGLTMDRYTHIHRDDVKAALGVLPDFTVAKPAQFAKAT